MSPGTGQGLTPLQTPKTLLRGLLRFLPLFQPLLLLTRGVTHFKGFPKQFGLKRIFHKFHSSFGGIDFPSGECCFFMSFPLYGRASSLASVAHWYQSCLSGGSGPHTKCLGEDPLRLKLSSEGAGSSMGRAESQVGGWILGWCVSGES